MGITTITKGVTTITVGIIIITEGVITIMEGVTTSWTLRNLRDDYSRFPVPR